MLDKIKVFLETVAELHNMWWAGDWVIHQDLQPHPPRWTFLIPVLGQLFCIVWLVVRMAPQTTARLLKNRS